MARFLFVFPPFVGHVGPAVGVSDALAAWGHEVAWVVQAGGPPRAAELLEGLVGAPSPFALTAH
jgi:UDP:flavonoid glycosyltransferase YjiC (YdhE family)